MKIKLLTPIVVLPLIVFVLTSWSCSQKPDFELSKDGSNSVSILENATVNEIQTHLASFKGENLSWSIFGLPGVCPVWKSFRISWN